MYVPPAFFWWWYRFDAYAPRIFLEGAAIAASGGLAAIGIAIGVAGPGDQGRDHLWVGPLGDEDPGSLGRAPGPRWCRTRSLRWRISPTRWTGACAVLCGDRSGKGVGLVIPTLLTWPGSAIVHDIKGENWQLTAGWRARFSRALLFDPTNPRSAAYNPLLEVRRGDTEVRDVQNIADILVDPEGALERRNHWEKTSHSLLVGAILHVLYAETDNTLAGVANFLSDPGRELLKTLDAMMKTPHLGACPHPVVASAARELLNKSENERSGVLSTATSFLGLYRDPVVAKVTSQCDWRISDLVAKDVPTTLYLVIPPSDITRTKPLVRLVLNQIGRRLTEELHAKERRRRLLLTFDEFPALGRLDFFESALAFMAGYGLKSFLIAQSLNQIESLRAEQCDPRQLSCPRRLRLMTSARHAASPTRSARPPSCAPCTTGHRLSPWLGDCLDLTLLATI
jgi:type IV secretion system protein VirD4